MSGGKKALLICLVTIVIGLGGFGAFFLFGGHGNDIKSASNMMGIGTRNNDFLLIPYNRAGVINKDWTIKDVSKYFVQENLQDSKKVIDGKPPKSYPITIIKPGTADALDIIWEDESKQHIAWIEIYLQKNKAISNWKLQDGYYVGMTLREMEKISGKSIPFHGFYNGIAGFVPFHEYRGLYPQAAGIQLRIGFLDERVGRKFMGDGIRWSLSSEFNPYKDQFVLACIGIGMNKEPYILID